MTTMTLPNMLDLLPRSDLILLKHVLSQPCMYVVITVVFVCERHFFFRANLSHVVIIVKQQQRRIKTDAF